MKFANRPHLDFHVDRRLNARTLNLTNGILTDGMLTDPNTSILERVHCV